VRFPYLLALLTTPLFAQSDPAPKFDLADIHVSAKSPNPFAHTGPSRGGRYELKTATMVDLIRIAYATDADKILGGPNWLEMDRFDVVANEPVDVTPETRKLMLQSLLADRFHLKLHKDTRPLPAYALISGKKPLLKPADGTEQAGCKVDTGSGVPAEGGITLNMSTSAGGMTTINLAPGGLLHYNCRNMTMAAFARELRGMIGANLGTNPILEDTGLKGAWNFDLRFTLSFIALPGANAAERVTMFDAVEKQLGLKLEQRPVPTPVLVVDSVNRKPSDNPPGVAEALPPIPEPTEFEVVDIKPNESGARGGRFQTPPGGRLMAQNIAMRNLLARAFNTNNGEEITGMPGWVDTVHFDINAKAPSTDAGAPSLTGEVLAPMLRALLADRFKMTYHKEEKPVSAYTLIAAKPKMKKADPDSRTFCKSENAPPNAPPGSQVIICQNATMAQFAERLLYMGPGLNWPVEDATEIEGGWDFTLTYSRAPIIFNGPVGGRGGDSGPAGAAIPMAADPSGGLTIFEAVEKQLGLKLETRKRTLPVIVIDHLEQKPTEN
jgi:uncharacterized protein (TIGR03435 family)